MSNENTNNAQDSKPQNTNVQNSGMRNSKSSGNGTSFASVFGILFVVVLIVIGVNAYKSYNETDQDKYDKIILKFDSAVRKYASDNPEMLSTTKNYISITELIDQGYLKSDEKTESIIFNPVNRLFFGGFMCIYKDKEDKMVAYYVEEEEVDNGDVEIHSKNITSNSFDVEVTSEAIYYSFSIDGGLYSDKTSSNIYSYINLRSGNHSIKIKLEYENGEILYKQLSIKTISISKPTYAVNGDNVIINYPTGNFKYQYTVNGTDWIEVNENKFSLNKKDLDYVIGRVYDGTNYVTGNKFNLKVNTEIVLYTVTFDSNGGALIPQVAVEANKVVSRPNNPTRIGYTFDDWYVNGEKYTFKQSVTNNIVIKARWIANEYAIEFNTDGGSNVANQKVLYGRNVVKPSDPIKNGYVFIGWYKNDALYDFSNQVVDEFILTAKWIKNTDKYFTVTFNTDGGSVVAAQYVSEAGKVTRPDDPSKDGYIFSGWYKNDALYDFNLEVTNDLVLVAKWTLNESVEKAIYIKLDNYVFSKSVPVNTKKVLKVLIIDIDPVLSGGFINGKSCKGITASACLGQNKQQVINELIEDIEYSSHDILDVRIVKTEYLNEFATSKNYTTLLNGTKSHKLDEATWLDIMKNGWYGFWDDARVIELGQYSFDYNYIINKYNLINRRNNNEFDEVWLVNEDPSNTYESMMIGNNSYWINGAPIEADCKNFRVMNVSISRPDTNFECNGHATEGILGRVFGKDAPYSSNAVSVNTSNYHSLNLWQKFTLVEHINSNKKTGLLGVGNVHFAPNSTVDYEWTGGPFGVTSKWREWLNYPNLTSNSSSTVFVPKNAYSSYVPKTGTISDARTHHRWWFSLMPHVTGVTNDGYSNNWWDYIFDSNYVTSLESEYAYVYKKGQVINDIVIKEHYVDGSTVEVSISNYTNNMESSDKSILRINKNNKIVAYKKGITNLTYYKDGRDVEIIIQIN